MKMGKTCDCECTNCYPLTVCDKKGYCLYRYGSAKNRVTGAAMLKSKGVINANTAYSYTCHMKRGVNNGK